MTFEDSLREAGEEILDNIAVKSAQMGFRSSGSAMAVPHKVTSRSGNLLNAVLGGAGSIREIVIGDTARFTIGVKKSALPYALLIHEGGVRPVTDKMRRFFWAKWYNTTGEMKRMFSSLRFKNVIRYMPRPYLEMGVDEGEIIDTLRRHGIEYLRLSVRNAFGQGTGSSK